MLANINIRVGAPGDTGGHQPEPPTLILDAGLPGPSDLSSGHDSQLPPASANSDNGSQCSDATSVHQFNPGLVKYPYKRQNNQKSENYTPEFRGENANEMHATSTPDFKSNLDQKSKFWEEYDRYAKKHDGELVDGLGDDLNSLLVFAGLFSATNTSFIIESMQDLKMDAADTTNDLLRALVRSLQDPNSTSKDLVSSGDFVASSRAIRVNSFFFASLCCSLFTAFGAVLGKQWLNHFAAEGSPRSLAERGRDRQMKFIGLKRWHLEGILHTLPTLLQFSLFFFLIGLIDWIWPLNGTVVGIIIAFSAFTAIFYGTTTIISTFDVGSPFQSRFTLYLRRLATPFPTHLGRFLVRVKSAVSQHGVHAFWTWPFILLGAALLPSLAFSELGIIAPPKDFVLKVLLSPWVGPIQSTASFIRRLAFSERTDAPRLQDTAGAQCIRWMLQQYPTSVDTIDAIIDATTALEEPALKADNLRRDLVTFLLKPSRIGVDLILGVTPNRLRANLGPLSCLINPPETEVMVHGDGFIWGDVREPWGALCRRLWKLLADNPHDIEVVSYTSQIVTKLGYKILPEWSAMVTYQNVVLSQQWLSSSILTLPAMNPLSPTSLSGIQLDYMTLFGCSSMAYFTRHLSLPHEMFRFLSSDPFANAFTLSLQVDGRPDGETWRARMRLLCLREMPEIFYPTLPPVVGRFSRFLGAWIRTEEMEACSGSGLLEAGMTPVQLYCDTLQLLLTQDHDLWHDELQQGGHLDQLQKLMCDSPTPSAPLIGTGLKLIPLHGFMSIWRQLYRKEPDTARSLYLNPAWVSSVRDCIFALRTTGGTIGGTWWFERHYTEDCARELLQSYLLYTQLAYDMGLLSLADLTEVRDSHIF